MRYFNNGSGFTVAFTSDEAWHFARRWPGADIEGPGWFAFDEKGDLIDRGGRGTRRDSDALAAFAEDCGEYGLARHSGKTPAQARKVMRDSTM